MNMTTVLLCNSHETVNKNGCSDLLTVKLSVQQKDWLLRLYRCHCDILDGLDRSKVVCVVWTCQTWSRVEQASISRTLKRLESRGFLDRFNTRTGSPKRTTDVAFTAPGLAFVRQLAVEEWGDSGKRFVAKEQEAYRSKVEQADWSKPKAAHR